MPRIPDEGGQMQNDESNEVHGEVPALPSIPDGVPAPAGHPGGNGQLPLRALPPMMRPELQAALAATPDAPAPPTPGKVNINLGFNAELQIVGLTFDNPQPQITLSPADAVKFGLLIIQQAELCRAGVKA